jgi:hypothetical protein
MNEKVMNVFVFTIEDTTRVINPTSLQELTKKNLPTLSLSNNLVIEHY